MGAPLLVNRQNTVYHVHVSNGNNINTVFCLIKAQCTIARLDLVSGSENWGSKLSIGGFSLRVRQLLRLNRGYPQKVEITPSLDSLPPTWTTCKMIFVSNVSNLRFFTF